jgi:hypothetical protein
MQAEFLSIFRGLDLICLKGAQREFATYGLVIPFQNRDEVMLCNSKSSKRKRPGRR